MLVNANSAHADRLFNAPFMARGRALCGSRQPVWGGFASVGRGRMKAGRLGGPEIPGEVVCLVQIRSAPVELG